MILIAISSATSASNLLEEVQSLAKIICSKCRFEDGGNFCSNCGSALSQSRLR